jgi:hypothetical protein
MFRHPPLKWCAIAAGRSRRPAIVVAELHDIQGELPMQRHSIVEEYWYLIENLGWKS